MGLRFYQTEVRKSSEELSPHALKNALPRIRARGRLCQRRPRLPLEDNHSRGAILLWDPQARWPPRLLRRALIAPSLLSDSFFLFFCCRRSGYCLLSSELRPSCLLLTAALETTAHHSTTPSGFLGHTSYIKLCPPYCECEKKFFFTKLGVLPVRTIGGTRERCRVASRCRSGYIPRIFRWDRTL